MRRKSDSIKQEPDDHYPSNSSLSISKFTSSGSGDLKSRSKSGGGGGGHQRSSKEGVGGDTTTSSSTTIMPFVSITPILGKGDAQVQ
jgi:hypothetical protein